MVGVGLEGPAVERGRPQLAVGPEDALFLNRSGGRLSARSMQTIVGREGASNGSGVQAKGGTSEVVIQACTFLGAGQRAINVGGSTGLEFFRPRDADCTT